MYPYSVQRVDVVPAAWRDVSMCGTRAITYTIHIRIICFVLELNGLVVEYRCTCGTRGVGKHMYMRYRVAKTNRMP